MRRTTLIILIFALCLAASISTPYLFATQNKLQAISGRFTVHTVTPTPTPTVTPTLTPTPTPEPSPTPWPTTAGQGRSSQPSISLKLSIDIMGQKTEWLRTTNGKLLEDVYALSKESYIALKIDKNTIARDPDDEPLNEIFITLVDPATKSPSLTPPTDYYFLAMYEFLPDGSSFSKPITIIITYNPSELPQSADQLTFKMYSLNDVTYEWEEIPSTSNIDDNSVMISVNYLSTYALAAVPDETTSITPDSPIPGSTSSSAHAHNSNLILLILILPAASLALFIYALTGRRRKSSTPADTELPTTSS